VDRALISALFFSLGTFLVWTGWRHWRYRDQDTITVLEAGILKATGVEPLPRARADRILSRIQAVLGVVLGSFFFLIGLVGIFAELEWL
jgi:hypothetical protein